jgi:uncharacterized protein (TIGR03067 family)
MLLVLLLVAVPSLAFAPAPFPRSQPSARNSVAARDLAGCWTVTRAHRTEANGSLATIRTKFPSVTITPTRWVFHSSPTDVAYDLRINPTKKPAEIHLAYTGQKEPFFQGVIERKDDTLRIIYSSQQRPTGFKNQPSNCYVLTLKRQ